MNNKTTTQETTVTTTSSYTLQQATSVSEVVAAINGGTCEGMEGIEISAEEIAGEYAQDCAADNDAGSDVAEIEANLDFIARAGAKFDDSAALVHALVHAQV